MRTKRKRVYYLDPRYRKYRHYAYYSRRHEGFTRVNEEGHSRADIVDGGFGPTPQKARLDVVKRRYRREPKPIKSARKLADDRRFSDYVHAKFERMRYLPREAVQSIKRKLDCDHEYRDTHPKSQWAYACDKCGSKGGIKPGRPDPLRDYF